MLAGRVHAVIAAGLENPQLLARWRQEPNQLRDFGVEPEALDLSALWKFAGLTAKVRHNGLRIFLPLTFRFLNVAGLEIEVFASYASFVSAQGARYADTSQKRAQELLGFLEHWLDFEKREHALLWDLFRYELALLTLSMTVAEKHSSSDKKSSARQASVRSTSVPSACGKIILHEMSCDPRVVGAMLQEKSPRLEDLPAGACYFAFWRAGASAQVQILELDELGFYLLSFIDGARSAADLNRLLGGSQESLKGFLAALSELAALGIISSRPRPRKKNR